MKNSMFPKIGAAILLVLAGTLALMGDPSKQTPIKSLDEWGALVSNGEDFISPMELSEWMMAETPGLKIVDVRTPDYYNRYHIDGAENLPFTDLVAEGGLDNLQKSGTHVLVCNDGVRAGQAWVILRGLGYEAYVLKGGTEAFVEQILEGKAAEENPDLALRVFALQEKFLGGSAAIGSAPPPPPPVASAPTSAPKRKKKSGGC
jgi:rhodanese-related sulfurtransferase